jgi:DNA mismatch repair protein MutL
MSSIHRLPDRLISQIAAGEVVERPASVLKEAIENALDAGARRVQIALEAGGQELVSVVDDGSGLDREDLALAFERHATSKITRIEDLDAVGTLGFRGEALAAIAAVSRVEALSATAHGVGHRIRIEGGRVLSLEPASAARGTSLVVRSLFFNVPARRKFLKTPATEQRRCVEVVQGYALARPDVSFVCATAERELLRADAAAETPEGRLERIAQLFGSELASNLEPLQGSRIASGFVGNRKTVRGRRLFVFVNGRLVRDRALLGIYYRSVRDTWHSEDNPSLFLFVELPPDEVDVNVHPQKAEVRFREPRRLGEVARALQDALARARGEAVAPLYPASPGLAALPRVWDTPAPWEAGGGREASTQGGWAAGMVAEPIVGGSPARLGELVVAPPAPAVVALSRGGEQRSLRVLGQYKGSLILLEGPRALYLVDQHAAHERVLYERFRRALDQEAAPSQRLLEPLVLDLGPAAAAAVLAAASELERVGFELLPVATRSVGVLAQPAFVTAAEGEAVLQALAARLAEHDELDDPASRAEAVRVELLESVAASRACRGAVRIHQPLTMTEMQGLVAELFQTDEPYACPHGRPTVLEMNDADLESRFGRR